MSSSGGMDSEWRAFIRTRWRVFALFGLGVTLAFAWAVYVFVWFVSNAQSSNLVPGILGLWTMGNLVTFTVYAILWGLLLVGVPVAIAGVAGWRWWRKQPEAERMDYRFGGRKRATSGGGGSLFFFIAFCIKVYADGKWNLPIAAFTLDYVVGSIVTIVVLVAVIFGIGAAIGMTWWIRRETKTLQSS